MIIGSDRDEVIENIKRAAESGNFFAKVETHDPVLTVEESNAIINKYLKERGTAAFRMRSCAARGIANVLTDILCRDTEIVGIEKAQAVSGGAIITSNHFSPVENTGIRPFSDSSFTFPAKLGKPVFALTITYKRRRFGKKPAAVIYTDGPFYPDPALPLRERARALHDAIYEAMTARSRESDCEYIVYRKKAGD